MPQKSKRQISVQLVDNKDYKDGFNICIDDGFVKYQYGLPNAKDGKNLLFEILFNDCYFKDLSDVTELFLQFFEQNLNLNDEVEQILKLFLQHVDARYGQMCILNTNIVDRVENFHLPSAPVKQNFQQATKILEQKTDDKSQLQRVNVAVFGAPDGFNMDTNIKSPQERNKLEDRLQLFYDSNANDGLKFIIQKYPDEMHYNFLVFQKNDPNIRSEERQMLFNSAKGRKNSFFGLDLILKNAYFTDTQQVYKVLSEFYYNRVVDKYITQYANHLQYNNSNFNQTDIVKEFEKYINDCMQNGKLQEKSVNVSVNQKATWVPSCQLDAITKEITDEFAGRADLSRLTLVPENTNPLERPNNIQPQIIQQNTHE